MKILIADDDPQILRALRINLTAHGYTVLVAADGSGLEVRGLPAGSPSCFPPDAPRWGSCRPQAD